MIVLDTDAWSYIYKADSRAELIRPHIAGERIAITFQTVAELHFWAVHRKWSVARIIDLEAAIARFVLLDSDLATSRAWADIRAKRAGAGKPIAPQDAWIAACARRHNARLLTHNAADYQFIDGLEVVGI